MSGQHGALSSPSNLSPLIIVSLSGKAMTSGSRHEHVQDQYFASKKHRSRRAERKSLNNWRGDNHQSLSVQVEASHVPPSTIFLYIFSASKIWLINYYLSPMANLAPTKQTAEGWGRARGVRSASTKRQKGDEISMLQWLCGQSPTTQDFILLQSSHIKETISKKVRCYIVSEAMMALLTNQIQYLLSQM